MSSGSYSGAMPSSRNLALKLALSRRKQLCIISPHLDDAAFSAFAAIQAQCFEHRYVVSVVTAPGEKGGASWARTAGFADPEAEFQVRQDEDRRAMDSLGVSVKHLGVRTGSTRGLIDAAIHSFFRAEAPSMDRTLYLLPGGAGGAQLRGGPWRLLNRLSRRPPGAAAHPEHIAVRDAATHLLLSTADACFGFYGEQPYVWNDSAPRLRDELRLLSGLELEVVRAKPLLESKLQLARQYESQFPLIFGQSDGYQRRALGREEDYFLVS